MWTVQAPHCAMPQPYLVPVIPRTSRMTPEQWRIAIDVDAVVLAVEYQFECHERFLRRWPNVFNTGARAAPKAGGFCGLDTDFRVVDLNRVQTDRRLLRDPLRTADKQIVL